MVFSWHRKGSINNVWNQERMKEKYEEKKHLKKKT